MVNAGELAGDCRADGPAHLGEPLLLWVGYSRAFYSKSKVHCPARFRPAYIWAPKCNSQHHGLKSLKVLEGRFTNILAAIDQLATITQVYGLVTTLCK